MSATSTSLDPFDVLNAVAAGNATAGGGTSDDPLAIDPGGVTPEKLTTGQVPSGPEIPGLSYLGRGYDIFGKFANDDSVKAPLFDFSADKVVSQVFATDMMTPEQLAQAFTSVSPQLYVSYTRPAHVTYKPLWASKVEYQTGGTLEAEQNDLSANVGLSADLGGFGGELKVRYDQSTSRLATHKFCSATAIMRYYEVSMDDYPPPALHPERLPVIPEIREDLDDPSLAPAKIFDNYGTHYLWAVTLGCSIVYGHTIDESKLTSKYDVHADMRAKYEGIGVSVGGGVSASSQQDRTFETITTTAKGLDAPGGSEKKSKDGKDAHETAERPLDLLRGGWRHPVLIDLPPGALKPIWELCSTPERRAELESAFRDYAKGKGYVAAAVKRNLRPLYLLKLNGKEVHWAGYRLWPNFDVKDVGPGTWATTQTEPRFYVFTEQEPGMVPLYEFYCDHPSSGCFRYETSTWAEYLAEFNRRWIKSSDKPVGYVYDGLEPAPDGAVDVYAYYPKNPGGHFRCYYSTDSADSRDDGGWRPMRTPADDGVQGYRTDYPYSDSVRAVLASSSNVHWRTPPL